MSSTRGRNSGTPTRDEPRYAAYRELAVTLEGHGEEIPVRAPDLSTRGIFINTPRHFPLGTVLCIAFRLTRADFPVKARGEVRYCLPGVGVGVEFMEISPDAQRAIEDEVSAQYGFP